MIDALAALAEEINDRLNDHIRKLAPVVKAGDFSTAYAEYLKAFPDVRNDHEGMREVFDGLCGGSIKKFRSLLIVHADLRLEDIFTFSLDDISRVYGDQSHQPGLLQLLHAWSHEFGDLIDSDPRRFLYTNPVLQRPFIRLAEGSFFWAQLGIYFARTARDARVVDTQTTARPIRSNSVQIPGRPSRTDVS